MGSQRCPDACESSFRTCLTREIWLIFEKIEGVTMDWTEELQRLRESTPAVDVIMKVYEEADKVHKEALIAMGQRPAGTPSPVASTEVVVALDSDLSSGGRIDEWNQ